MKKKNTTSENVFILSDFDKTIVRKYKSKKLKWDLSTLSQKDIFDTLKYSNIKHPLLLKKRLRYIDMEYIPGKPIDNTFDKIALSGLLCNYIYELTKVDCSKIIKKIKWNNNTEFFYKLINQTMLNIKKSKYESKLNELGLSIESLKLFFDKTLDNQRKLSFIHGDINRRNIINNNGNFYLINWDTATYGDIAYEISNHIINENYTSDEIGSILERISSSNGINQTNLIHDIQIYIEFEYRIKCINGIIDSINNFKKGKNYNNIIENIYDIFCKINPNISKEQLKEIIERK